MSFDRGARIGILPLVAACLFASAAPARAESGERAPTPAIAGTAVAKLVRSVLRPDAQPERELRKVIAGAERIFTNSDGLLPPSLPTDIGYLIVAAQAGEELLRREVATIGERAQLARLLCALAVGAARPATELVDALRSEARVGEPDGFIRRRAAAIAGELPAIARAAAEDARRHGAVVLAAVPNHTVTRRALGELELRMGDAARAAVHLEPVIARAGDDAEARLLLGEALLATGRDEDAAAALDAAVAADPLLAGRAERARRESKWRRELEAQENRPKDRPLTTDEALERVDLLLALGRLDEAVGDMRALLRASPDDAKVRKRAAQVYVATLHVADWQALTLMGQPRDADDVDALELQLVGTYLQLNEAMIAAARSGTPPADRVARVRERLDEVLVAYADKHPEAAFASRLIADGLVMATLPPGERVELVRSLAARVAAEQPASAIARRVAAVLLLTVGEPEAAALHAREGLPVVHEAERDPYTLFTAQVHLTAGARSGDAAALERALELVDPLLERPEGGDSCPSGCFDHGIAWATRAAALDALALLGDEDRLESRFTGAEEAGERALSLLRVGELEQARIAASILHNRAYRALRARDVDAARSAIERARRIVPVSPQGDMAAGLLALLDRDFVPARDLLAHGLLLGPNTTMSLGIRKWLLLTADRMGSREDFVAQLRAIHAIYTQALPSDRPVAVESMSLAGSASAKLGYGTTSGFVLQATIDQALTLLETQPSLTRDKVAHLMEQVEAALGGEATQEGGGD
jgi:tetratricopeptide (TPR) repeat protein